MSTDDDSTRPEGSSQPAPEHEWPTTDTGEQASTGEASGGDAPTEQFTRWSRPADAPETAAYGTPGYGAQPSGEQTAAYGTPAYGSQQPNGDQTAAYGTPATPGAGGISGTGETSSAPAYGQPSGDTPGAPVYGQPAGDAPSAPAYGQPSGYGQAPTSGQPAPDQAPYGQAPGTGETASTGYSAPGYGQAPYAGAPQGYGSPQQGYGQPGTQQPGYGQAGAPAHGQPGYPPPGAPGGSYPGYAPYPGPGTSSGWDGPSIASLVTAVLGIGPAAVVLGIIGLRRTKKNATQGKWMAIVGLIYGGLQTLLYLTLAIAIPLAINHENAQERAELDRLYNNCADGSMSACDDLYWEADIDSPEEEFASTCGGTTTDSGGVCELQSIGPDEDTGTSDSSAVDPDAQTYGDDPTLDAYWDACAAGDPDACSDLAWESPWDSEYEQFGLTCGNRAEEYAYCADEM